jgi:hypothetical protein
MTSRREDTQKRMVRHDKLAGQDLKDERTVMNRTDRQDTQGRTSKMKGHLLQAVRQDKQDRTSGTKGHPLKRRLCKIRCMNTVHHV